MKFFEGWRTQFGKSYWAWKTYHFLVADATSIQRPTKYRIVYQFLGDELGRTADIGCGPGVFTRFLCEHASEVWAADIDISALDRLRARNRKQRNLGCVVTLADRLPFPNGVLDTVLFLEVLEHLPDDGAGIGEVWRVLAPGGKLVISVPMPPGEVNESDPWGHKREGYQLVQLQEILEDKGFEISDHRFAQFIFSRVGEKLVQGWRRSFRMPAPIFLTWLGYLDFFISNEVRRSGGGSPACVIIVAHKRRSGFNNPQDTSTHQPVIERASSATQIPTISESQRQITRVCRGQS